MTNPEISRLSSHRIAAGDLGRMLLTSPVGELVLGVELSHFMDCRLVPLTEAALATPGSEPLSPFEAGYVSALGATAQTGMLYSGYADAIETIDHDELHPHLLDQTHATVRRLLDADKGDKTLKPRLRTAINEIKSFEGGELLLNSPDTHTMYQDMGYGLGLRDVLEGAALMAFDPRFS